MALALGTLGDTETASRVKNHMVCRAASPPAWPADLIVLPCTGALIRSQCVNESLVFVGQPWSDIRRLPCAQSGGQDSILEVVCAAL